MEKGVNEKDWKLFQSRLPGWQETYMERIVEEYSLHSRLNYNVEMLPDVEK